MAICYIYMQKNIYILPPNVTRGNCRGLQSIHKTQLFIGVWVILPRANDRMAAVGCNLRVTIDLAET